MRLIEFAVVLAVSLILAPRAGEGPVDAGYRLATKP
jgi:hypothetical protein